MNRVRGDLQIKQGVVPRSFGVGLPLPLLADCSSTIFILGDMTIIRFHFGVTSVEGP
jgi:hypothetical protein